MSLRVDAERTLDAADREDKRASQVLTTSQCAKALGVSLQFIRGEIRDKRLPARVLKPSGRRRALIRIDAADFDAYRAMHWPKSA